MKAFGVICTFFGIVLLVIAFNVDVSLEVPGDGAYGLPRRVNNIGLMDQRRNYMILAGLLTLCGVIFIGFGSVKRAPGEIAPADEKQPPKESTFGQGERTLENDVYKIYLVKNYKIEFNETLKKHIFNDSLYESVDDALAAARAVDLAKMKQAEDDEAARKQWELAKSMPPPNADAVCPNGNCSVQVRHDDLACWKCGADFTSPQGWKPVRS